jgi:archaetidylinositol phosphate synthase
VSKLVIIKYIVFYLHYVKGSSGIYQLFSIRTEKFVKIRPIHGKSMVEILLRSNTMSEDNFTGDKKVPMKSLLADLEKRLIMANVDKFPKWIEGYHLTLMTIPWTIGMVVFGFLAANYSLHWLWGSSLMLVLQWFTDSFDGALGRHRDTGIPKWGFYMDHFLDYLFMSAVFIGWTFFFEGVNNLYVWFMVMGMGALMVNSFLAFGATGEFKITYLRTGPTEMRLSFIVINTVLIIFGTDFLEKVLIYVLIAFVLLLVIIIYRTQKYVWAQDMQDIKNRPKPE